MNGSAPSQSAPVYEQDVLIGSQRVQLEGTLAIAADARVLVLFAHGSGSSRFSARNRRVAAALQKAGLATLLFDLLTPEEEHREARTGALRFDIPFLAARLQFATDWARRDARSASLHPAYFGASTGAAAALVAAADPSAGIVALVSRGGRPDLAGDALARVQAPTLLIVGGNDGPVIPLNEAAYHQLGGERHLEIVPGASHLFEEPGTLDRVAQLAARWFNAHTPAERRIS